MKTLIASIAFLLVLNSALAQNCDPLTPVFSANLTGQPNGTWISPSVPRFGYCCGITSGSDQCIQFNLTLDPTATAIMFDIYSGAVPGGSMFFQVNCGPMQPVGQAICLSGAGPHIITFCKPGNNDNEYIITSIRDPELNGTQYVTQTCIGSMVASNLEPTTIQWTSVPFNAQYNSFLNCTTGCDSVTVIPPPGFTGFIDYRVCGDVLGGCTPFTFCDTLRINFVNDLDVNITPVNPTICFGGANAIVTANGSGGLPPYRYVWSTGDTTASISVGPGTYYVSLVDQMNCSSAGDTVVVTALANPITANAGPDGLLCLNEVTYPLTGAIVAATGGIWSGGGTFSPSDSSMNATYTPSPAEIALGYTDLRLITTGNFGCPPDTDYVHVQISPNPTILIAGSPNACIYSIGQYNTTYTPGNNYQWSATGGTIVSQSQNVVNVIWTNAGSNSVSVIIENPAGCDTVGSMGINTMPKPLPILAGTTTVCLNSTELYSITNQNPGSTYTWTVTNGVFIDSSSIPVSVKWLTNGSGSISVREINSQGCDSLVTLPINIIPQPTPAISGNGITCNYSTAVYSTNFTSGHNYNWNVTNGTILSQNNNSIVVHWNTVGFGTINLTEINPTFCDSTTTFTVNILPTPLPVINGPQTFCARAVATYFVTGTSLTDQIGWYINGGTIIGSTTGTSVNVIWANQGIGGLRVQVVNQVGCDSIVEMIVNILEGVEPEMEGPARACRYDTSVYSVSNVQNHIFFWQVTGGNVLQTNGNSITVCWQTVGTGSVTVTETSPAGCDSTITINVTVDPTPLATTNGSPIICQNENGVFYTNPTSGNSYQWSLTGGNIIGSTSQPTINSNWPVTGQFNVTLREINTFGCMTMSSLPVQVVQKPAVNITGNQNGCINMNSTFNLVQSPGTSYNYSVTGGVITSQSNGVVQVRWLSFGTHTINVNAVNNLTGCTAQNTLDVLIAVLPHPVVNATSFNGCPPLTISLSNNPDSADYHYTWNFGNGNLSFDANPDYTYTTSGQFPIRVSVVNQNGCVDSASAMVNVFPGPTSQFNLLGTEKVYAEYQGLNLENNSQGGTTYLWDFGNGDGSNKFEPHYTYDKPGTYDVTLEVVNSYGCRHTSMKTLEVIVPENIFIPNSFTPNGDSKNDYFSVGFNNIVEAHIYIYNRWGELIFKSDDMNFKWDGKRYGSSIQNDVYICKIEAIGFYGHAIHRIEKLTVIH